MLVEINLLPEKQKKNYSMMVAVSVFSFALAAIVAWAATDYLASQRELQNLESKLEEIQTNRISLQNKIENNPSLANRGQSAEIRMYFEGRQGGLSEAIDQLVALVPDGGKVLQISYEKQSGVNMTVQFRSLEEVALYLQALNDTNAVKRASLLQTTKTVGKSSGQVSEFIITLSRPAMTVEGDAS